MASAGAFGAWDAKGEWLPLVSLENGIGEIGGLPLCYCTCGEGVKMPCSDEVGTLCSECFGRGGQGQCALNK